MSKICLFNTQVAEDSAGDAFVSVIPIAPLISYTKPVRLPVRGPNAIDCTFEFIYSSSDRISAEPAPPGGLALEFNWWREFWGDDIPGSLKTPPSDRVLAAVYPTTPWSREPGHVEDPAGVIANLPATRQTTLIIPEGEFGAGLWVTTKVHAPWVRLGLNSAVASLGHVLINAHVGGHDNDTYLDANGDKPFAYNV